VKSRFVRAYGNKRSCNTECMADTRCREETVSVDAPQCAMQVDVNQWCVRLMPDTALSFLHTVSKQLYSPVSSLDRGTGAVAARL
jgi:hypothetical protein